MRLVTNQRYSLFQFLIMAILPLARRNAKKFQNRLMRSMPQISQLQKKKGSPILISRIFPAGAWRLLNSLQKMVFIPPEKCMHYGSNGYWMSCESRMCFCVDSRLTTHEQKR